MALFQIDVQKELRGEYWTNRYCVELGAIGLGVAVADSIVDAEKGLYFPEVNINKARVSDFIKGGDQFIIINYDTEGTRVVASQALPLFDTARVDFSVGIGRPSRKYLRGSLAESDQEDFGALVTSYVTGTLNPYINAMLDIEQYVDVDGQAFISGAAWKNVQMRQLRRGSKRRITPVI